MPGLSIAERTMPAESGLCAVVLLLISEILQSLMNTLNSLGNAPITHQLELKRFQQLMLLKNHCEFVLLYNFEALHL